MVSIILIIYTVVHRRNHAAEEGGKRKGEETWRIEEDLGPDHE